MKKDTVNKSLVMESYENLILNFMQPYFISNFDLQNTKINEIRDKAI